MKTGGKEYDLWMLKGIEQRFDQWLNKKAESRQAVLGVKNGWYVGDKKVMDEVVVFTVRPRTSDSRAIDLDFTWTPIGDPITLAGAEGKSYGGLTLRFAPRTNTVITTPLGIDDKDLPMTRLAWADLMAKYPGVPEPSGVAIFVPESHPDFRLQVVSLRALFNGGLLHDCEVIPAANVPGDARAHWPYTPRRRKNPKPARCNRKTFLSLLSPDRERSRPKWKCASVRGSSRCSASGPRQGLHF